MKRAFILVVLMCAPSSRVRAADKPPVPPLPSPLPYPRVPPGAIEVVPNFPSAEAPLPYDPSSASQSTRARKRPGRPRIVLGDRDEFDHPRWSGAGVIPPAKFAVKAEGGGLTAVLTGAADSHAFFGIHSVTLTPIQLVQEFEILPGDRDDARVMLSVSGKLDGYIRSEKHSRAWLRQADAVVYPVSGGSSISLDFSPASAADGSAIHCVAESKEPPQLMPAGRYVLVINLVLETTAGGIFRGHSVAVFKPDFDPGDWRSEADEIEDLDDESFGLAITLKTATPAPD